MEEVEFSRYFRRMFPRLVAYACRTVDAHTAQDLASRTLETLWSKDVPTPRDADGWQQLDSLVFAILRGLLRNEARAERRRGFLWLKAASAEEASVEAPEPGGADAPAWFRDLPVADQRVLALLAEGYTAGEIAGIVDSTPAAVTKRISRARQRIRDLIHSAGGAEDV